MDPREWTGSHRAKPSFEFTDVEAEGFWADAKDIHD